MYLRILFSYPAHLGFLQNSFNEKTYKLVWGIVGHDVCNILQVRKILYNIWCRNFSHIVQKIGALDHYRKLQGVAFVNGFNGEIINNTLQLLDGIPNQRLL